MWVALGGPVVGLSLVLGPAGRIAARPPGDPGRGAGRPSRLPLVLLGIAHRAPRSHFARTAALTSVKALRRAEAAVTRSQVPPL